MADRDVRFPLSFNLSQMFSREHYMESKEVLKVNDTILNNISYADETALIANSEITLQTLLEEFLWL